MIKKIFITILYSTIIFTATAQKELYLDATSCPFQLGEPVAIIKLGGEYNHPIISPDGTKVLVTKKAYTGIYLIDLEKGNQIQPVSTDPQVGFCMKWSEDGKVLYTQNEKLTTESFEKKYITYDLKTNLKTSDSYFKTKSGERELQAINNVKERIVQATDGIKTWNIVSELGVYYDLIISPDKSKVLVHKNDGRMYIYAMDGSGLISCIGHGLCQSWSPDGKFILYFISEDDGHSTSGSDIYIGSVNGLSKWKITNTSDTIELWPYWSSKGNVIVYKDLKSGAIYKSAITKK